MATSSFRTPLILIEMDHHFITEFSTFVQQQSALIEENRRTNLVTQNALIQLLERQSQSTSFGEHHLLGAPRKKTDTEFLLESLSSSLSEFVYDPENDCIFENWFRRYEDFFDRDAANLDDAAKVRLLLRKLETSAHKRYINFILPKISSEFNFIETVEKLKKLFGRHESLFRTRFKCFKVSKTEEMNYLDYTGNVNKTCEDFELNKMSIDQFKFLIFVAGLSSSNDTRLLSKLETEHDKITLEKLSDEYGRLINLKKDASMIQKSTGSESSILVNQVSKKIRNFRTKNKPKPQSTCDNCGRTHSADQCPAATSKCSLCSFKGHWVQF